MSSLGNKQIMSENLNRLMKEHGISRNKLCDDLNLKYTTATDWIKGNTYPRIDKIELLANYFNVQKSALVEEKIPDNIIPINEATTTNIPLIGTIACGDPITAEQNIEEYIPTLDRYVKPGKNFYLTCKGNSMAPTLLDGYKVLIHTQPTVEDGEIAAVLIDNEATLKRVKHSGNRVILMPDNKDYEPIILDENSYTKILGKASIFLGYLNDEETM